MSNAETKLKIALLAGMAMQGHDTPQYLMEGTKRFKRGSKINNKTKVRRKRNKMAKASQRKNRR